MLRNVILKLSLVVCFTLLSQWSHAQTPGGGMSPFFTGVIVLVVIFMFAVVVTIANRLMRLTAERAGVDVSNNNFSIIPTLDELTGKAEAVQQPAGDAKMVRLKKGYDIPLAGAAASTFMDGAQATTFAVKPTDIQGMSPIPKVVPQIGESVKAGDVLFYDKKRPEVQYVAPVSGELIAINRGAKRRIEEVVILADKEMQYKAFEVPAAGASREELKRFMLESGAWSLIKQRPFNVAADPSVTPRDIFISTFDTAPLAPDLSFVIQGKEAAFQKGLDVLAQMTDGAVHLGLDGRPGAKISAAFAEAQNVQKAVFTGKHPAGNVGVQIHHVAPIAQGDVVWTLDVQAVATIGTLFLEGKYDASRVVALTGAELKAPQYVNTYAGASIETFIKDNLTSDHVRYITGDVLSGKQIENNGFLGFFDDQVTVVAEGDYYEMFGWLLPIKPRASISATFPKALYPSQLRADTNTHGEKRAFVVTGQYEKVTPMDIYPQHLLKSILVNDFERMEGLGIYEVVEEDLALCEFVCTSKQPVQQILREGIDNMIAQG